MDKCVRDMSFGALVKGLRVKAGLTLRRAAELHGMDPGNLSKMERNLLPPPSSARKVGLFVFPYSPSEVERELVLVAAFNQRLSKLREDFNAH